MIKEEFSIIIERPIEEVFAYIGDPRNDPRWQSGLLEVRLDPNYPVRRGTKKTEIRTFLGRRVEAILEVTEYEPNSTFASQSASGPFPVKGAYLLEPAAGGTKLTFKMEMQAGGFFALAEPLVGRGLKRSMVADFGTLKDLLESRVVGSPHNTPVHFT